MNIGRK